MNDTVRLQLLGVALVLTSIQPAFATVDGRIAQRVAALSVAFVPNAGQWDEQAAFAAHTFGGTLFVTKDGRLVYRLPGIRSTFDDEGKVPVALPHALARLQAQERAGPAWVLIETLVDHAGEAVRVSPAGRSPQAGTVGYAIGRDESKHKDGLRSYERVGLGFVYPGIDVQYRATGNNVEKIFTLAPHADPLAIRLRLDGAQGLEIGGKGELIVHTGNGPVTYTAPIAYQQARDGARHEVPVRYALDESTRSYGFTLGAYDSSRPLVIDPLLQSTYLGSTGVEAVAAMAIHPVTGEVYVAGATGSTTFPKVAGAEQSTLATANDAYVTRLDAALTTRLQSTYLGGNGTDAASAIAIHPISGEVYVAGFTTSTDFPNVDGAEQTTYGNGAFDAFVTRLNPELTLRLQSTYLGGSGDDRANALAIHPASGDVYVTGLTTSTNFPKVAGAEQSTYGGGTADAYVTRLNAALTVRLQSTYLGGGDTDYALDLAIHPATGEVYVAGYTKSNDFPKTAGSLQPSLSGTSDAFVTRLNPLLTTRLRSTYFGGTDGESANALAIDPRSGDVYIGGYTLSTDLPKVAGAEQTALAGASPNYDGFVARLNAALTFAAQSTYLGGSGDEYVNAMTIHPATGDVYVTGTTDSTNFPKRAGAEQSTYGGGTHDAFVTRLNASLTTRLVSTYLGGTNDENGNAVAIHLATGEVYVGGYTTSTDFPKVAGAEQTNGGGQSDGFVSRYSLDLTSTDMVPNTFGFAPKLNVPPGSQQTSDPVQVSGFLAAPISIVGGNFAQYCIANSASCSPASCAVPFGTATSTVGNGQYVCVRQTAPLKASGQATATLIIGGGWADFLVTTGTLAGSPCTLDVDDNGATEALTDGLLILRAMMGLTGSAVTDNAVGGSAKRSDWASIRTYLNGNCGTGFGP